MARGLRAAEVISLKVSDIDSKRMIIRVEQGAKARKDRYVMAFSEPARTAARLVAGGTAPRAGCFQARNPVQPMTTRQLNRACHAAAQAAGIEKKRVSAHACGTASLPICSSRTPIFESSRFCSVTPSSGGRGGGGRGGGGEHGALYAGGHQDDPASDEVRWNISH